MALGACIAGGQGREEIAGLRLVGQESGGRGRTVAVHQVEAILKRRGLGDAREVAGPARLVLE